MSFMDDYAAIPAVNVSTLKELAQLSPRHYRHRLRTPRDDSPALAFGRLVHCAVLEPETLSERYVVMPDFGDLRTKAAKERREEWLAEFGEVGECVTAEWWQKAQCISVAVRGDSVAAPYLERGRAEVTLTWEDQETGVSCKGRLDWITDTHLVGLKTTRTISPRRFATGAADYGYHLQWAFYSDGYESSHGIILPTVEIVVESEPPFDVIVYEIPDDVIDEGRIAYRDALMQLVRCRERDEWPGIARGAPLAFSLPRWATHGDEDSLDGLEF